MKLRKGNISGDVELNLTPMIDVTFQLIIFFMVGTEMSRAERDYDLRLPHVDMSMLDKEPPPDRLILNITRDGTVRAFGRAHNDSELRSRLKVEADTGRKAKGDPSDRPIHIRADRETDYKYVEKILWFCTRPDIRIWKISFGAAGQVEQAGDATP